MRTVICGGGTAGHVYPALAVVEALRDLGERQEDILYVGAAGSVEERLAGRHGLAFARVESGQLRGRAPWTMVRSLARTARGVVQAQRALTRFQPHVLFSTGGYASAPALIAARRVGLPTLIYLPDAEPGVTIKLLSRLAQRVAVSFEEVQGHFAAHKVFVSGYPVRKALFQGDKMMARRRLSLAEDSPVLLAFGGSQGARSINLALAAGALRLAKLAQVIHITGSRDFERVRQDVQGALDTQGALSARYRVYEYLHEEMTDALLAADLVVARAGASTLGEFPAVGAPAILSPYPYSGQHQYANARFLERVGAALVIEDRYLASELIGAIERLLGATQTRARMSAAARALARPAAAQILAQELQRLAAGDTQE